MQCRNASSNLGLQAPESNLLDLNEDLLVNIIRFLGTTQGLRSLVLNKQLHRAWQLAVCRATLSAKSFNSCNTATLAKLGNIHTLAIHDYEAADAEARLSEEPVCDLLVRLAPSLIHLRSITLWDVNGGFSLLKLADAQPALAARLQHLGIRDGQHVLNSEDLWALRRLKALQNLAFQSQSAIADGHLPDDLGRQLAALQQMQLATTAEVDVQTGEAVLAVFPGSLTSLKSLQLRMDGDPLRDEQHDVDAALVERQERQLVNAVSALIDLKTLTSTYALQSPDAQRKALSALEELTELELSSYGTRLVTPFVMLDKLPELQRLVLQDHIVVDPFSHPSLHSLTVAQLITTAASRQRPEGAEPRQIQHIEATGRVAADEDLRHLPYPMPQLETFIHSVYPSPCDGDLKLLNLAGVLSSHASSLQHVVLRLHKAAIDEDWPEALPACHTLSISGYQSSNWNSLTLMSQCSFPKLSKLELVGVETCGLEVQAHLGWLRSLPALRELFFAACGQRWAEVEQQVAALMEGSGVRVRDR